MFSVQEFDPLKNWLNNKFIMISVQFLLYAT